MYMYISLTNKSIVLVSHPYSGIETRLIDITVTALKFLIEKVKKALSTSSA